MTVRELIEELQRWPLDAHVIRPGEVNGDWAMVAVDLDEFEFRYANHPEAFGEYLLQDKRYVNSMPVVVLRDRG